MSKPVSSVEAALRSGSRARNFSGKITDLCRNLPAGPSDFTDSQRKAVLRLAAACRSSKAVSAAMSLEDVPAIDEVCEFSDLFCVTYYPVLEDGKRTVAFWSVKDSAALAPDDVHEWVLDRKFNKKTNQTDVIPVPFGTWWRNHRPDYDLYGVASDRASWTSKIVEINGRKCVNTMYGKPPVLMDPPAGYGTGVAAQQILDEVIKRTITDTDLEIAHRKRQSFILDVGAHLLALRDGGDFRCRKIFCFTSTNAGQGTGKSFLHEAIAALVPRDASCTVPTTLLAGGNLLPLYGASVCILTEAPSTVSERYTAEDVKAFADAGWKTAEEKYVAKRAVCDNSLKLLSSNHLAPLPIDSAFSRRVEFFVAEECNDGGAELRKILDTAQAVSGWSAEQMRACVGWALLERARHWLEIEDGVAFPVARRTIHARHLLSTIDYDYFVGKSGNAAPSYSAYRDYRSDVGMSWSPDRYRFDTLVEMSKAGETWIDGNIIKTDPPKPPKLDAEAIDKWYDAAAKDMGIPKRILLGFSSEESVAADAGTEAVEETVEHKEEPVTEEVDAGSGLQYKRRMATAYLEKDTIDFSSLYCYIIGDKDLEASTKAVRSGEADKKMVLRQVFPGARFRTFSRSANIVGFTGLTHVDFDKIAENGNGLTPAQVRDAIAELPGFIIGAVSARGNGAWGIFHAGDGITDYPTYEAASRSLFAMAEEKVCMQCDKALRLPTAGRTIAHDPDCRIADEAIAGLLPEPYPWKAPTFAIVKAKLRPVENNGETTADEKVRNERFLEAVVDTACAKIQNAGQGERHDTAIKSVANVVICCQDRGITPLSSWGRRLREACSSCGLPADECNSIMAYWRQKTGLVG